MVTVIGESVWEPIVLSVFLVLIIGFVVGILIVIYRRNQKYNEWVAQRSADKRHTNDIHIDDKDDRQKSEKNVKWSDKWEAMTQSQQTTDYIISLLY